MSIDEIRRFIVKQDFKITNHAFEEMQITFERGGSNVKNICIFCGGDIYKDIVTVVNERKGKVFIIENVPAGVCTQCGEKEYDADVVSKLETIMTKRKAIKMEKLVPVADFTEV